MHSRRHQAVLIATLFLARTALAQYDPKMPAGVPEVTGPVVENVTMHYIDVVVGRGTRANDDIDVVHGHVFDHGSGYFRDAGGHLGIVLGERGACEKESGDEDSLVATRMHDTL